jgi:hypothetical protein
MFKFFCRPYCYEPCCLHSIDQCSYAAANIEQVLTNMLHSYKSLTACFLPLQKHAACIQPYCSFVGDEVNAKDAPTKKERERAAGLREQGTAAGISVTANTAPPAAEAKAAAATAKACCAGHAVGQDHSAECATQPVADAPAPSAAGFARGDDAHGWPTHPNILDDESTDEEDNDALHKQVTHHILYNSMYIYTSCILLSTSR